jgi:hypothetical protein
MEYRLPEEAEQNQKIYSQSLKCDKRITLLNITELNAPC